MKEKLVLVYQYVVYVNESTDIKFKSMNITLVNIWFFYFYYNVT